MPSVQRHPEGWAASRISGAGQDNALILGFSATPVEKPNIDVRWVREDAAPRAPDPGTVLESVRRGLNDARAECGTLLHLSKVVYFRDDANRPEVYRELARVILLRAASAEE